MWFDAHPYAMIAHYCNGGICPRDFEDGSQRSVDKAVLRARIQAGVSQGIYCARGMSVIRLFRVHDTT
jgi:hypothetical protein